MSPCMLLVTYGAGGIPEHVFVILNQIGSLLYMSVLLFETTCK